MALARDKLEFECQHLRKARPHAVALTPISTSPFEYSLNFTLQNFYVTSSLDISSFSFISILATNGTQDAVMDRRIFDQLDTLERGARIERRPKRDVYHDERNEPSPYAMPGLGYGGNHAYDAEPRYAHTGEELIDQPMVLDSFGTLDSIHSMRLLVLTSGRRTTSSTT